MDVHRDRVANHKMDTSPLVSEDIELRQYIDQAAIVINQLTDIVFYKNPQSVFMDCNQELLTFSHLQKKQQILGKEDYDLPWADSADFYRKIDARVMMSGNVQETIISIMVANGERITTAQKKHPLRNTSGDIIGIIGINHAITDKKLLHALQKLKEFDSYYGHNGQSYLKEGYSFGNLSNREEQCMFYLLRGKTAKRTAEILNLSPRTVETYIDNLKTKLHCRSKSELIEKAIDMDLLGNIPTCINLEDIY